MCNAVTQQSGQGDRSGEVTFAGSLIRLPE